MRANEFVKKFGVDEASEIVHGVPSKYMECYYSNLCWDINTYKYSDRFKPRDSLVNIAWLKRLVKSWELIKKHNGLGNAKSLINHFKFIESEHLIPDGLEQAIADVESCQ